MDEPIDESTAPNEFICPISQEIMKDPVLTCDGFCFERRFIEEWLRARNTNPLTNMVLPSKELVENRALRNVIEHHNLRVRQIERQANQNAQKAIKVANQSLIELFPGLVSHLGFIDLDKLMMLSMQNCSMRDLLTRLAQGQEELRKLNFSESKGCNTCKQTGEVVKISQKTFQEEVSSILNSRSLITNMVAPKQDEVKYLLLSNQIVKLIDFKRLKKSELKKCSCKGILLSRLTLEEVVVRIRLERNIDPRDFVRVWVASYSIDRLYEYISTEVVAITGSYIGKVRCIGRRLENLQMKVRDIGLDEDEYLVIEHGVGEEYVFRDKWGKCDYCHKKTTIETECECKKVAYCSLDCQNKDKVYHTRVCKLNEASLNVRPLKK